MKVSYNWLNEYIDIPVSAKELAEKLTNGGVEVEKLETANPGVDSVIVGQVVSVKLHPQADNLKLANVDIGEDNHLEIVCGAPNVKAGQKIPVALPNTKLPNGTNVKETVIKEKNSEGMICSCEELNLLAPQEDEGIFVLGHDAPIGQSISDYLGLNDTILEFDLTPNRGDCLNMLGVAREVSALYDLPFVEPEVKDYRQGKNLPNVHIKIEDSEQCNRYIGTLIEEVEIGTSPIWLQQRLRAYGVRPINNFVDITNYVMLEYGQPLHAFDFDLIEGEQIIVRQAYDGEEIKTLDERTHNLSQQDLIIADQAKPIAIAGVMGGYNTEVHSKTKRILLEAAAFNNISVRRTANRYNLRSEASLRFEKGVDPNNAQSATFRALELIEALGVGKVVFGTADAYPKPQREKQIELRPKRVRQLTGLEVKEEDMNDIFRRLGFCVEKLDQSKAQDASLMVHVPTRRPDIAIEVDLIEEVARLFGYNNIPTTMPNIDVTQGRRTHSQQIIEIARETMLSSGFSEIISYTFINPDDFDRVNLSSEDPLRQVVPLANPMTRERSVMRTIMYPSFLKVLEHNSNQGERDLQIFETGKVYYPQKLPLTNLPVEKFKLIFGGMGNIKKKSWLEKPEKIDFFYVKGAFQLLLQRLNISLNRVEFKNEDHPSFHPTRTAGVYLDNNKIGFMGDIDPDITSNEYELPERVTLGEVDLEELIQAAALDEQYVPLPRFPALNRDLAFIVPEEIPESQIYQGIANIGEDLIEDIRLFDLYQGGNIPEGKKSLAYTIKFRDPQSTLTDERVDQLCKKIESHLKEKFGAEWRTF